MASTGTYYIDTADFSTATAVWIDATLTTKAPDGYYSFEGNYRQQSSGILTAISTCTVYYNTQQSATAARSNCPSGYTGGDVTLTVAANTYSSPISVAIANQLALDYIYDNLQDYANANGTCTAPTVYYNTQQQLTLAKNNCSEGSYGSDVTLTVAANTYSSYVSVAVANQLAIDYLYENAQDYANANGTCTLNNPSVTYTYYGIYYYNDPCQGFGTYYTGSDGNWYEGDGINFSEVTGGFVTVYDYYDYYSGQYLYVIYNLVYGGTLSYWGTTTSYCYPY